MRISLFWGKFETVCTECSEYYSQKGTEHRRIQKCIGLSSNYVDQVLVSHFRYCDTIKYTAERLRSLPLFLTIFS